MELNYHVHGRPVTNLIEPIEGYTIIDGTLYEVQDNAPVPMIYGISTICLSYDSNNLAQYYDVIEGRYFTGEFKGLAWLNKHPETTPNLPTLKTVSREHTLIKIKDI